MRVEKLSDHPAAQVRGTENAIDEDRRRVAAHERAVIELKAQQRASRRWWQIGTILRHAGELNALKAKAPRIDPRRAHRLTQRLAQQQAGVRAEDQVTFELGCALDDDWTCFRGYRNRRGEIDHLLVGPRGVWAAEVKCRSVTVHVEGDHWWFDKFDRYGNRVETGALTDGGGRTWGREVSDPSSDLQKFLRSRGVSIRVRTAVVVMHARAALATCEDLRIDVIGIGTEYLVNELRSSRDRLDPHVQDTIRMLVRRDHAFHTGLA